MKGDIILQTPAPPRRLKFNRHGLAENPLRLHCTMKWKGRDLLGEIIGYRYNEVTGYTHLIVRHFNGELWPIQPTALTVEIIG